MGPLLHRRRRRRRQPLVPPPPPPPLLLVVVVVLAVWCRGGSSERLLASPGSQWSSEPSETIPAGSAAHCALLCVRRAAGCPGADFRRGAGVCQLQPPADQLQPLRPTAAADSVALQRAVSCRQLQRLGYSADGVYPVAGLPVPLYCDMSLTLGGGWTLLVAAASMPGWSLDNVLERNSDSPSITRDYSILRYGDKIKSVGASAQFRYRYSLTVHGCSGRNSSG